MVGAPRWPAAWLQQVLGRSQGADRGRECEKKSRYSAKYLDRLIEKATVDAYNESEQAGGFFAPIEEHLAMPFATQVLGQEVTVASVDMTSRDQIVAICSHGKVKQAISILDLPMPDPPPEGAE